MSLGGGHAVRKFLVLLIPLLLVLLFSTYAQAATNRRYSKPEFTIYAGNAATAPDDALENMPLD